MPPKCKFTKQEIVGAAFSIAKAEGFEAVTARALGERLGSSTRPIFSCFHSMDEVLAEVKAAARGLYGEYVSYGLHQADMPAFKGVGMQYIRFALTEPKLFQLLFMCEQRERPDVENVLPAIDENYPLILASVQESYQFTRTQAERLYQHLWIYSHGIAVLCATRLCSFTGEDISRMLTEVCTAMIRDIKANNKSALEKG